MNENTHTTKKAANYYAVGNTIEVRETDEYGNVTVRCIAVCEARGRKGEEDAQHLSGWMRDLERVKHERDAWQGTALDYNCKTPLELSQFLERAEAELERTIKSNRELQLELSDTQLALEAVSEERDALRESNRELLAAAHKLAMLVLQSSFYVSSPDVKQATDDLIAFAKAEGRAQ